MQELVYAQRNIQIVIGDITEEETEAIVNAANTALRPGGGVDGAIHRKAGSGLSEECLQLGGCPVGEARITKGHNLKAKWVIHTVGPIWRGGSKNEAEKLAKAYRNSLLLAAQKGIKSISFPAISTGAYGFPKKLAARIALGEARNFLKDHQMLIRFVCFDRETAESYLEEIENEDREDPPSGG